MIYKILAKPKNIKISATQVGGEWYDIGSFDQYLEAHEVLQTQNVIKHKNVLDKNNTLSGKIFIGEQDVKIDRLVAILNSVTVSMAALTSGALSPTRREKREPIEAASGVMAECCGTSSTSSKVRASRIAIERSPSGA
mgnify:CR=1 FL=1